jgi:hypothetical protein
MTAVADATTVIETLLGRTLTAQQLQSIGNRMVQADPYGIARRSPRGDDPGYFADYDNPTNEEKAQLILDSLLLTLEQWNRKAAVEESRVAAVADQNAAGDTADADLA